MTPTTRTGLHVFAFTASAVVAILAVATDTPLTLLLMGVPGAAVIYILHLEHQATNQASKATTPVPLIGVHLLLTRCPESPALDDTTDSSQHALPLHQVLTNLDITPHDLWRRYSNDGGTVGELEIDAYLHDSFQLPPEERDRLNHAAHELLGRTTHPPQQTTQNQPGAEHAENHRANVQD